MTALAAAVVCRLCGRPREGRLPGPPRAHVPWTVSQTDVLADDWDVLE